MISNDLAVRLPEGSDDELGGVGARLQSDGRALADRLQYPGGTGRAETRSLAQRNHELSILYAVTSFSANRSSKRRFAKALLIKSSLHWGPMPVPCGSISQKPKKLTLVTHDGLSDAFLLRERELELR